MEYRYAEHVTRRVPSVKAPQPSRIFRYRVSGDPILARLEQSAVRQRRLQRARHRATASDYRKQHERQVA